MGRHEGERRDGVTIADARRQPRFILAALDIDPSEGGAEQYLGDDDAGHQALNIIRWPHPVLQLRVVALEQDPVQEKAEDERVTNMAAAETTYLFTDIFPTASDPELVRFASTLH